MKSGCPDNETLTKAFQNNLSKRDKDYLVDHIFNCPKCRLKFEALKRLNTEMNLIENIIADKDSHSMDPIAPSEKTRARKIKRVRYAYLVSTAMVFVLTIGIGYLLLHHKENRPVLRDGESTTLQLIEPKGKLSSIPSKFLWTRSPNDDYYDFRIIDEDLNTIVNLTLHTNQYILTNIEKAKIMRKKIYLWSVRCKNDNGEGIDFSQAYFEIQ